MRNLEQEFGRAPSANEIAEELEISPSDVMDDLRIPSRHQSLDASFEDGEDNNLHDVLKDEYQPSPDMKVIENSLKLEIEKALLSLTDREAEVICLYFGINRDNPISLEDISMKLKISRERTRQIKEKALSRLRNHNISKKLRTYFLDSAPEH